MRIFVYEHVIGGGLVEKPSVQLAALAREGRAMLCAVAEDFAAIPGCQVYTLLDSRLDSLAVPSNCRVVIISSIGEEKNFFTQLAQQSDWTLVIAPETDGILRQRVQWAEATSTQLLSPNSRFVATASNKAEAMERLTKAGVPVPRSTCDLSDHTSVPFPAVLKRIDGAGSLNMRWIDSAAQFSAPAAGDWVLEEFIPGRPASVSLLCGASGCVCLAPFWQRLRENDFHYLGGDRMMDASLSARAARIAKQAAMALGTPRGYVGVDLVLGEDVAGSLDRVIEINPRLTSSYIGLRQATSANLAEAMLAVAQGELFDVPFNDNDVGFTV